MTSHPTPPRVATWLLSILLDPESREAVVGDLCEGYTSVRARHGRVAAWWLYWGEAARTLVACRITGRRRPDERRFDFLPGPRASIRDLVRPALRQFRDHPLYALTSVGTLALAVGAACVSLAIAKRALVDPLPYRDGNEIVSLLTFADGMASPVSAHVLDDLRRSTSPLVQFAPIRPTAAALTTAEGTESRSISFVDQDYFALLGVTPALGRVWTAQEPDALVISGTFWREHLGRRDDVLGSSFVLDGRPRTVVGVMPEDFLPPYFWGTDVWAPIDMPAMLAGLRTVRPLTVLARRAPDVSQDDLDAYMTVFSRQMQERFPQLHGSQAWVTLPLRDELVGSARPALLATAGAALLLLLIVAANLAGLSTAHAVSIRHHLAVRTALGATRSRLFIEQLCDSFVLGIAGSLSGILIAAGLMRVVVRYQEHFLPRMTPLVLDTGTMALGLIAGLAVGLTAALLPRGVVTRSPYDALRTARGSSPDIRATAVRSSLVVVQVAIALVLLVGAGLLVRTVQHLAQRDLGFDSRNLTWLQVNLPGRKYQSPETQMQFERDVLDRIQRIPGVETTMASVGFPLWGGMMAGLAIKSDEAGKPRREVAYLSVSPNFVADVGARIVEGRNLSAADDHNAPRVVVINETMARTFWPGGGAVGAEVQIGPGSPNERWITVVGIMADMRAHGLTNAIRPTAFGSTLQFSWPRRHIAVRTAGEPPPSLAADLKRAIHATDPTASIGAVTSAAQNLSSATAQHRLVLLSLGVLGAVALLLCISGLYAVIMLNSQQRRREYAIRVALGAASGGVRWMVVRQALVLGGTGAAFGLMAAALGTRTLQGLLHGVQPLDPLTFALSAVALLGLATLAAWQPARQAERINPIEALRAE